MYWTIELISYLDESIFPATKDELIDYVRRSGAPFHIVEKIIENLEAMEEESEQVYESVEDVWPDCPAISDYYSEDDEGDDDYGSSWG